MSKIKVSIIIPVYNAEKYLDECLTSVINQTYRNIEIICVNDDSKDGSLHILNKWVKKDQRIKIINQSNSGPFLARNNGVSHSCGDYLMFLDADDYILDTAVEKLVNYVSKYNSDVIKFKYNTFPIKNDDYDFFNNKKYPLFFDKNKEKIYNELLTSNHLNNLTTMFVSKKVYNYPNIKSKLSLSEDFLQSSYIYTVSKKILFVNDILYFYRYNVNSTTHSLTYEVITENIKDEFEIYKLIKNLIKKWDYSKFGEKYELLLFDRLINNIIFLILNKLIRIKNNDKTYLKKTIYNITYNISEIEKMNDYKKNYSNVIKYRTDKNKYKEKLRKIYIKNIINENEKFVYILTQFLSRIIKLKK